MVHTSLYNICYSIHYTTYPTLEKKENIYDEEKSCVCASDHGTVIRAG